VRGLRKHLSEVRKPGTNRNRGKEDREKLEARLRTVIESLPFDFFGLDLDGRYFIQNSAGRASWGAIIGKRPEDLGVDKETLALWQDNNRRAFSGEVVKEEVEFVREGERGYYYNIIAPIYSRGKIDGILGFNIDITKRKKIEEELQKRENDLQIEARNLEEANVALKVLLKRRDEDAREMGEKVLLNVKELIMPYLDKLKMSGLDERCKTYVSILESNLNQITSPFSHKLSFKFMNFTPTEIQMADMLRQGKTNKEISGLMQCSLRTIAFHRQNIRKKLDLKNRKVNLKSYLLSLAK
jgi:PAS domain S-box-containing protein